MSVWMATQESILTVGVTVTYLKCLTLSSGQMDIKLVDCIDVDSLLEMMVLNL